MAVKYEGKEFKKITLDDMMDFIEQYYPEDKAWFKKVAYQTKNGIETKQYNHLNAVRKFCERYNPALIPVAKEPKEPKTKRFDSWDV